MNNYKIIKERFDLNAVEGQTVKAQFELDSNARFLLGIVITSDRDDLLFYRGSQKIQINDRELFPDNYESKLLIPGLNVALDDRFATVGPIPTGNGKLDVWFKDSLHPLWGFAAYRVSVYAFSVANDPSEHV